jgi:hypothetical protein
MNPHHYNIDTLSGAIANVEPVLTAETLTDLLDKLLEEVKKGAIAPNLGTCSICVRATTYGDLSELIEAMEANNDRNLSVIDPKYDNWIDFHHERAFIKRTGVFASMLGISFFTDAHVEQKFLKHPYALYSTEPQLDQKAA